MLGLESGWEQVVSGTFVALVAVITTFWIMIKYDRRERVLTFVIITILFIISHDFVGLGMYERGAVRHQKELMPDILYQKIGQVDEVDGKFYVHLTWAVGRKRALFQLKKEPPAKFVVDDRNGNFVAVE